MGSILGAVWCAVLETFQGGHNISGHGDINILFCIVPLDGKSTVICPGLVNQNLVMLAKRIQKVVGITGASMIGKIDGDGGGGGSCACPRRVAIWMMALLVASPYERYGRLEGRFWRIDKMSDAACFK
jgi:hypothetical protein